MKANVNSAYTTSPKAKIIFAVSPLGVLVNPSEKSSPAMSRNTPLMTAVAIRYGR